jgi:hypothetical protein
MLWGWLGLTCDDEGHRGQHPCNLYESTSGKLAYTALAGGLLLFAFYQSIIRHCLPETVATLEQVDAGFKRWRRGQSASSLYVPRPDSCCDQMVCVREREDLYCASWTHNHFARGWSIVMCGLFLTWFVAFIVRWKILYDPAALTSNLDIQLIHALFSVNLAFTGSFLIWLPPTTCPPPLPRLPPLPPPLPPLTAIV